MPEIVIVLVVYIVVAVLIVIIGNYIIGRFTEANKKPPYIDGYGCLEEDDIMLGAFLWPLILASIILLSPIGLAALIGKGARKLGTWSVTNKKENANTNLNIPNRSCDC